MEKDKKIIKHLRESRETLTTCCSKLIKSEAECKQFLLAIQDRQVVKEKNMKELDAEMAKMHSVLNELVQKVKDFENTWLKGSQKSVVSRTDRGRRDNVDSGILSADSKYMQPSPESSDDEIKIITHPTKDCKEKDESSSNAISLLRSTNEDESSGACMPSEHEDKDPIFHTEDQDQAVLSNEKGEDAQSREQMVEGGPQIKDISYL